MSRRYSSSQFPTPEKKKSESGNKTKSAADESTNALWRLDQWFPHLDPALLKSLHEFHTELLRFNVRLNLISRTTEREADEVHFADSLLAAQALSAERLGAKVYDIGAGNGLPGLVFGMLYPKTEFFLVESDSRKCEFIKHMAHALKLTNVQIMNVRTETLKGEAIPVALSRGFASVSKTVLSLNKCFERGGKFYHLKGGGWSSEIAEIPSQLISIWRPELLAEYSLPSSQARRAVVLTTKVQD